MNPTLFSLCFTGKARRNIACAHCLSDNHTSDTCPDNPSRSFFWSQHPGATFPHVGGASPVGVAPPVGGAHPGRLRIYHLFNAIETAQNARTLRASLPMCAQPARQTIRDLLVQKHREYRQTQVEGVECPSTSGFVIVVGTQASGTRHVVIVNQYHAGVIFTCLSTYLLG